MSNVSNSKIAMAMKTIAGFISLTLGRKAKIIWGAEASCGPDGTIRLPRPKTGEAEEISMMTRQALHEAGHHEHTDFSHVPDKGVSPDVFALINALEDPRMEREQMKVFPGAGLILNRGLEETIRTITEKYDPGNPEHASHLVTLNLLVKGFRKIAPHKAVINAGGPLMAMGDQVLGPERVKVIDAAVEKLVDCASTEDVVALATQLWDELNPPPPPEQPAPQPESSDPAGEDADAQQSPSPSGEAPADEPKPEGSSEGDVGGESPKDDNSEGASGGEADSQDGQQNPPGSGSDEASASGEPDAGQQEANGQSGPEGQADGQSSGEGDAPGGHGAPDGEADSQDGQQNPSGSGSDEAPASGEPGAGQHKANGQPQPEEQADGQSSGEGDASGQQEPQELPTEGNTGSGGPEAGADDQQPPQGQADESSPQADAGDAEQSANSGQAQQGKAQGGQEGNGQEGSQESPPPGSQAGTPSGNAGGLPRMDLSSAMNTDLGQLLAQAYEAKYGKPDVQAQEQGLEATESEDDVAEALAVALQQAEANGESLEQALEELQALMEAASSDEADAEQAVTMPAHGAGGGNAAAEPVTLDVDVRLSGVVSRLVRVFTKELQDKRRRPVKYEPAGGQVASNRVWRLKRLGDPNVFRVRKPVAGIDAAAMILLDKSGSMEDDIVQVAEVSFACSQALERISKVKTSIEMFPGHYGDPLSTITLQPFGLSARHAAKRIDEVVAHGGTPLTEALQQVVPKLLEQRTKKHVLILVSDGSPNNPATAIEELSKAARQGVELMGIGIGDRGKAIEGLVPYSVCVNEASELPDALEKLFSGRMAVKLAA